MAIAEIEKIYEQYPLTARAEKEINKNIDKIQQC